MPTHVTADELAELVAALNPAVITGTYNGPGSGGIVPTRPAGGLLDPFNRDDSGDGTLGQTDFGHYAYSYIGTPAWHIGIGHTVTKNTPSGAAALLDFGSVNQGFSVTVNTTDAGEEIKLLARVDSDAGTGYVVTLDHTSNNNGGTFVSLGKLDGTVLFGGNTAAGPGPNVFDGSDHVVEVHVNVGDFLILIDGVPVATSTENPVTLQSGTKFGFDSTGTQVQFDNVTILYQPIYQNFRPQSAINNGSIPAPQYPGGYPDPVQTGNHPTNHYGNGLEWFDAGFSLLTYTADLAVPDVSVRLSAGSNATNRIYLYLHFVDPQNFIAVKIDSFTDSGQSAVHLVVVSAGNEVNVADFPFNHFGGPVVASMKGLSVTAKELGTNPSSSMLTLDPSAVTGVSEAAVNALLAATGCGFGGYQTNYSVVSDMLIQPV